MNQVDRDRVPFETPYRKFPLPPNERILDELIVYDYIQPREMQRLLRSLSNRVKLADYEGVLVNLNAGRFLFEVLVQLQLYKQEPIEIEYHRSATGFGANIVTAVPEEIRAKKLLVVESVIDSGGVAQAINKDAPNSSFAVVVHKNGVNGQIGIPNVYAAIKTDNVWYGGCGADFGAANYPKDFPRKYPGIVVMPESITSKI